MKKLVVLSVVLLIPSVVFAAPFAGVRAMVVAIIDIIGQLRAVAVGLALLFFFWGIAKFIRAAGDEEEIKAGKRLMIWGVVALFVMVSVGGLIMFLQNQLGVRGGGILQVITPNSQTSPGGSGGGATGGGTSGSGGNSGGGNTPPGPSEGISPFSGGPCDVEASEGSCPSGQINQRSGSPDISAGWAPCGPDSIDEDPC